MSPRVHRKFVDTLSDRRSMAARSSWRFASMAARSSRRFASMAAWSSWRFVLTSPSVAARLSPSVAGFSAAAWTGGLSASATSTGASAASAGVTLDRASAMQTQQRVSDRRELAIRLMLGLSAFGAGRSRMFVSFWGGILRGLFIRRPTECLGGIIVARIFACKPTKCDFFIARPHRLRRVRTGLPC